MLVSLLLEVEERLARHAGWQVTLADTRAFSLSNSPFRDVNSLVQFICNVAPQPVGYGE
jgi:hypothetical protein